MKYYSILLAVLFSSCSANWNLKQAKRHIKIAEQKGAVITPDTVFKQVPFFINIEGDSDVFDIDPEIDVAKFDSLMSVNDLLVLALNRGKDVAKAIKKTKKSISRGFLKDSVYAFQTDSLTTIFVAAKGGRISSVKYIKKPSIKSVIKEVPVLVTNVIKPSKFPWLWIVVAFILGCFSALSVYKRFYY